jgi:hypothetical protein
MTVIEHVTYLLRFVSGFEALDAPTYSCFGNDRPLVVYHRHMSPTFMITKQLEWS